MWPNASEPPAVWARTSPSRSSTVIEPPDVCMSSEKLRGTTTSKRTW
jgi:hypothetical protein